MKNAQLVFQEDKSGIEKNVLMQTDQEWVCDGKSACFPGGNTRDNATGDAPWMCFTAQHSCKNQFQITSSLKRVLLFFFG